MVFSRIQPDVEYPETKTIASDDKGHVSDVFELEINDSTVMITLGKIKYNFVKHGIVYFPIYLVENKQVKQQIGVYEVPANVVAKLFDDKGNIDIDLLDEELLFHQSNQTINTVAKHTVKEEMTRSEATSTDRSKQDSSSKSDVSVGKNITVNQSSLFSNPSSSIQLGLLPEETMSEANEIVAKYNATNKTSKQNSTTKYWVQKYFHNPYYKIHQEDIESNGDCFFAVIREAFKQKGMITTVAKLRKLLSENISNSHFLYYHSIKDMMEGEMKRCDRELRSIKQTIDTDMKRKLKSPGITKTEMTKLIAECKDLEAEYKSIASLKKEHHQTLQNLLGSTSTNAFDSLETFQEHVLKSSFWADEFSILTMERLLRVKFIILSGDCYQENSIHQVVECGFYDGNEVTQPEYYIIATLQNNHYELVSYKDKKLLKFQELPFTLKEMISVKCVEKTAGAFPYIDDFTNFRRQRGYAKEDTAFFNNTASTNSDTIFMFYQKSFDKAKPGKGSGEQIPIHRLPEFIILSKIPNWRRKLDDSWIDLENPLIIENKRFASVYHYLEYARFRKQFPDFAKQFSLNSESDVSKRIENCKEVIKQLSSNSGEEPPVHEDPDFRSRRDQERERALFAKFEKQEMKSLLLSTKDAILIQFRPRNTPLKDELLMKIRNTWLLSK